MKRLGITWRRIDANMPISTYEKMQAEQERRRPLEVTITDLLIEAAEKCYTVKVKK